MFVPHYLSYPPSSFLGLLPLSNLRGLEHQRTSEIMTIVNEGRVLQNIYQVGKRLA